MEVARGDAACIRFPPKANDVISRKFMRDHICLYKGRPPFDLDAFCRDFRQGPPRYQVMLLTNSNIRTLRNDLQSHQRDFYNDRYGLHPLRQGISLYHYTTRNKYTFIYCEYGRGKIRYGLYQQYVPVGTPGVPYQIFHGCPPVRVCPGFKQVGAC